MPVYEPEDFNKMTDPEEMDRARDEALSKKERLEENPRSSYEGPGEKERRAEIAALEASFVTEDTPVLGCEHGRAVGVPCPWCLGINNLVE